MVNHRWSAASIESFKSMRKRNAQRHEAFRAALPPAARWAPPEWAPKGIEARANYERGYERLANEPILFAFCWDFGARAGACDGGLAPKPSEALLEWGRLAPAAMVAVPASCLWRLAGKEKWRSFCCQASSLSPERLRAAVCAFADRLGEGFHEKSAAAFDDTDGATRLSSQSRIDRTDGGGFCAAFYIELNPGRLVDEEPLKPMEAGAHERLEKAKAVMEASLGAAGQALISELSAGWELPPIPRQGPRKGDLFSYASGSSASPSKELASRLCRANWEAGEIERGLAPADQPELSKAARPRI